MASMAFPKLTRRDLFWLALIIAMGVWWWADSHARLNEVSASLEEEVRRQREDIKAMLKSSKEHVGELDPAIRRRLEEFEREMDQRKD
jgi:hypothetical protein